MITDEWLNIKASSCSHATVSRQKTRKSQYNDVTRTRSDDNQHRQKTCELYEVTFGGKY